MLEIRAARFGGPEVLVAVEAPDPVAGPGQVVIAVSVADTLHLDTVLRRGAFPFPVVEPPYVPGGGVAGEVIAVGPGVDRGVLARRVVARTGVDEQCAPVETVAQRAGQDSHTGGYAQQAVVPAGMLVPVPSEVPLTDAAALVNDGMTAMMLAEAAAARPGEWVLITPAGGGVGTLLIQLAYAAGARVVGAARGEYKLAVAQTHGAHAAVDYGRPDWTEQVRAITGGRGADVVLDGVGGDIGRASLELAAPGGRFIGFGAPSGTFTPIDPADTARRGVTAQSLLELPMRAGEEKRLTQRALAEAVDGRLKPVIGRTFPLRDAAAAHAAIEAREVTGKTLLLT